MYSAIFVTQREYLAKSLSTMHDVSASIKNVCITHLLQPICKRIKVNETMFLFLAFSARCSTKCLHQNFITPALTQFCDRKMRKQIYWNVLTGHWRFLGTHPPTKVFKISDGTILGIYADARASSQRTEQQLPNWHNLSVIFRPMLPLCLFS